MRLLMEIKDMEPILQFIVNNKIVLPIMFIAFVIQFLGLQYLVQNKHSDFSYSEHEYQYFEGSLVGAIIVVLAFGLGIATIGICCIYIKTS